MEITFQRWGISSNVERSFIESDYNEFRKNVILDQVAASSLFQGTDAIGKTIEIKGEPFIVVGIVELASTSQPVIHSIEDYYMYHQDQSGTVFMPDATWLLFIVMMNHNMRLLRQVTRI